ncbi:MAG TPA: creatininase family protein [Methanomassiliicoccales archaeon]|nr:creatininase family protein [Methanomassiliicoccales archaeon]
MRVEELSSAEFAKFVRKNPVVFLPLGATEAHGIHLPLGTDSYQPEALCEALADCLDGLVMPMVRYGHHSSTRNMPGTMTLTYDTLRAMIADILDSMERNGLRRVVVISGHAGSLHLAAVRDAAEEFVRRSSMKVMVLTDYDIAYKFPIPQDKDWPDGHGGLIETSRILALRPDLVKKERPRGKFLDKEYMVVADPETCMPEMMAGDTTRASAELGNEINQFILDRLVELISKNMRG